MVDFPFSPFHDIGEASTLDNDHQVIAGVTPHGYILCRVPRSDARRSGGIAVILKAGLNIDVPKYNGPSVVFEHDDIVVHSGSNSIHILAVYKLDGILQRILILAVYKLDGTSDATKSNLDLIES